MASREKAVFGGGCFWCTEAVFQMLRGVYGVTSGYAGGGKDNPSYEEVSGGDTGHAEVIMIEFDPSQITYQQLLEVFFSVHDPTTLNRQGNDIGTQYRSIILYTTDEQKTQAGQYIATLEQEKRFASPITTEIAPLKEFFKAEGYHQEYYRNNQNAPYCRLVIDPKIQKLKKTHQEMLSPTAQ